ncbi:hypothetical protein ACFRI7_05330 [Streptomyces sp. NPDC056716]|uniref:hypothetical protein n=1 Tax=unclassified Streptomyces TaxID=2593676 RepID=UPI00369985A2
MLRKAAAILVLAGAVSGCGLMPGGGDDDRPAAPLTTPAAEQDVELPLESYYPTPEQDALLTRARGQLILECMQSFGLTFDTGTQTASAGDPYRTDRFLLSDAKLAADHGYHSAPEVYAAQEQAEAAAEESGWKPTADEKMVYGGAGSNTYQGKQIPDGGCREKAFETLSTLPVGEGQEADSSSGSVPPDIYFVQGLRYQANEKTAQDSRVLAMEGSWSSCMQQAGHRYDTPAQAANDPRWQEGTVPQPGEVHVATADVKCKEQANYLGVMTQATTEYQMALIEENAEALDQFQKDYDEQLRRATATIAGEPVA